MRRPPRWALGGLQSLFPFLPPVHLPRPLPSIQNPSCARASLSPLCSRSAWDQPRLCSPASCVQSSAPLLPTTAVWGKSATPRGAAPPLQWRGHAYLRQGVAGGFKDPHRTRVAAGPGASLVPWQGQPWLWLWWKGQPWLGHIPVKAPPRSPSSSAVPWGTRFHRTLALMWAWRPVC